MAYGSSSTQDWMNRTVPNNVYLNRNTTGSGVNDYLQNYNTYQGNVLEEERRKRIEALNRATQLQQQALNTQQNKANLSYDASANQTNEAKSQTAEGYDSQIRGYQAQMADGSSYRQGYQNQRNQISASIPQQLNVLREKMAAKGMLRSGTSNTNELAIRAAASQQMRDVDTEENRFLSDLELKVTDAQMQRQNALSSANNRLAELEAARQAELGGYREQGALYGVQAASQEQEISDSVARQLATEGAKGYLDYQNLALQAANVTGEYGGNKTLNAQQMALDEEFRRSQLTQEGSQFGQSLAQQERIAQLPYDRTSVSQAADIALREKELAQNRELNLKPYENMTAAQAAQIALQQANQNQQNELSRAELTGTLNGEQTLSAQQMAINKAIQEATLAQNKELTIYPYQNMTVAQQAAANQEALNNALNFVINTASQSGKLELPADWTIQDYLAALFSRANPNLGGVQ